MKDRLVSLDAFRGLTVALMILVNNPGSWAHIHPPLRHAAWHGLTPTDLVFPFFLFIVGTAMSLSFARRIEAGAGRGDLVRKIVVRALIIFACGLFLNGFPFFGQDFGTLRIMGVLQRIALSYLGAGLVVVFLGRTVTRAAAFLFFVALYELAMRLPLVAGWGGFALETNLVRWVDLGVLTEPHMYRTAGVAFDPEGLLSTLTATATTLLGFFTGEMLRREGSLPAKLRAMAIAGTGLVVAGLGLALLEPVNKQLWTTSYVVITAGLALLTLAACSWMVDLRGWKAGVRPAVVYGSNPLVVFLGSGLLVRILLLVKVPADEGIRSLGRALYLGLFEPAAGPVWGSFFNAVVHVVLWLGVSWWLWRRRIFVKI